MNVKANSLVNKKNISIRHGGFTYYVIDSFQAGATVVFTCAMFGRYQDISIPALDNVFLVG